MADLQALFHNPEVFSDADLSKVKNRIRMQKLTPYVTAGAFGGAYFLLNQSVFKRAFSQVRLAQFAVLGYVFGGAYSYKVSRVRVSSYSEMAQTTMDQDILTAFETRYAHTSLNAAGYGNNALTAVAHSHEITGRKKPY